MSSALEEVQALQREGARAVRHFLVFWFGLPTLFLLIAGLVDGVISRGEAGRYFSAIGLSVVGGLLVFALGKVLWRVIKK